MLNPVCDRPGGKSIFTIVIPAQTGIPLPSFYGHACMDAGGRAASGTSRRGSPVCGERAGMPVAARRSRESPSSSFRRRPESSGLFKTFPRGGNDNTQAQQPHVASTKTCHPFTIPTFLPGFLGGLFPTRLRQAGAALPPVWMQAGRNDDRGVVQVFRHTRDFMFAPIGLTWQGQDFPKPPSPTLSARNKGL